MAASIRLLLLELTARDGAGVGEVEEGGGRRRLCERERRALRSIFSIAERLTIRHKLNVTHVEDHVQRQTLCNVLQYLECLLLRVCVAWDLARLYKAIDGLDVVWVILGHDVTVDIRVDRLLHPFVLTLAHFPFAIKVPFRFGKQFRNVGSLALQDVPHIVCAHDIGLSALLCFVQA